MSGTATEYVGREVFAPVDVAMPSHWRGRWPADSPTLRPTDARPRGYVESAATSGTPAAPQGVGLTARIRSLLVVEALGGFEERDEIVRAATTAVFNERARPVEVVRRVRGPIGPGV